MPDVTELLAELPEHPPVVPRPAAEIQARAHRRRQRRRLRRGGGLVAVVLAIAAITGGRTLRSDDDRGADVDTGPVATPIDPNATPATTVDDGIVRVLAGRGLRVDPDEGLDDGDRVTLTLTPDPGGSVEVMQCAAEVVGHADGLDPSAGAWCGSVFYLRDAAGAPDMGFEAVRRLGTSHGTVDCAAAPGRCVVVARPLTPTRSVARRYAPLVFRDDLDPLPEPQGRITGTAGPIEDGRAVRLEASGLGRRSDVLVTQCSGPAEDLAAAGEALIAERCDSVRYARVRTDDAGRIATDVLIFHDIAITVADRPPESSSVAWEACAPCSLVIRGSAPEAVVLPLDLASTDDPIRPVLDLAPPGPHRLDDELRIDGSGFQADTDVAIGLCTSAVPPGEAPACSFAANAFVTTDAEGSFAIHDYRIPALEARAGHCTDAPAACSLNGQRDGRPAAPAILLHLSG